MEDKNKKEKKGFKTSKPTPEVRQIMKDLCMLDGVPGHEAEVRDYVKNRFKSVGLKSKVDNLGSIIGIREGDKKGPRVLVAGHLDEIGFIVTKIEEQGYVRITPVGGWWPHVLLSQRMTIITRTGKKLVGVVGSKPPHVLPPAEVVRVMKLADVYIDMGCATKEEVLKAGINIGDPIVPDAQFSTGIDENVIFAKAIDNRAGVAVATLLLERLQQKKVKQYANLYSGGTVQEEVGLRGARTLAYSVNPDIAIAVDTTIATDTPGMTKTDCALGKGVSISILDGSVIGNPKLIRLLEKIANKHKIPFVFDTLTGGGTDAGEFHLSRSGVITVTLSIPTRYIHSHQTMCHLGDVEAAVQLLEAFISELTEETFQSLRP